MMPPYRKSNLASALGANESLRERPQAAPRYLILETSDLPMGCRPGDSFSVRIISMNGSQSIGMIEDEVGSKESPVWTMPPESPAP